jgi:hypothetical protein
MAMEKLAVVNLNIMCYFGYFSMTDLYNRFVIEQNDDFG